MIFQKKRSTLKMSIGRFKATIKRRSEAEHENRKKRATRLFFARVAKKTVLSMESTQGDEDGERRHTFRHRPIFCGGLVFGFTTGQKQKTPSARRSRATSVNVAKVHHRGQKRCENRVLFATRKTVEHLPVSLAGLGAG